MNFGKILNRFPVIDFGFAYGSGVFEQTGYSNNERPMIDMIFVVSDPKQWHNANLKLNSDHYALPMRWLGGRSVSCVQGDGVYFNPFVRLGDNVVVKYGVISMKALKQDLRQWNQLYVSGRLHKPVRFISSSPPPTRKTPSSSSAPTPTSSTSSSDSSNFSASQLIDDAELRDLLRFNLDSALATAVLLLSHSDTACFDEFQLYETIASLSYEGDIRMKFAENPQKIFNIVSGNFSLFRKLYEAPIERYLQEQKYSNLSVEERDRNRTGDATKGRLFKNQQQSDAQLRRLIDDLPLMVRPRASTPSSASGLASAIEHNLKSIVRKSSSNQSFKGLISAGAGSSLKYVAMKIIKRFK